MKYLLLALLTFSVSAFGDYVIEEKMEQNGAPAQDVVFKLKDGKARCDIGTSMSSIAVNGEIKMLMHAEKEAMTLPLNAIKQKAGTTQNAPATPLQPTGHNEKISGYDTEEYVHENPKMKSTAHYWIAKDVPDGTEILKMMESMQTPAAKQMAQSLGSISPEALPGIPIRMELESNLMGKPFKMTTTITSIKKEPVDDSFFTVPADYRQVGAGRKEQE